MFCSLFVMSLVG